MSDPGSTGAGPDGPADTADLATVAAGFAAALRAEGLPAGTDRSERFARAVTVSRPATLPELYWCGVATFVSDPEQMQAFARVFSAVFGGMVDPADARGQRGDQSEESPPKARTTAGRSAPAGGQADASPDRQGSTQEPEAQGALRAIATADERLANRDFSELSADELAMLTRLMTDLSVATPLRRTRRYRRTPAGRRTDLRSTLRRARRTGGEPFRLARGAPRKRPRRLVVLCDISGSMEPYARAMLQLLYCATGAIRAEVFTFATRLTRLTPVLEASRPAVALERAGQAAPDWSGGTRIGEALKEFNDLYGRRGMARGAVILVISDGWETGDPALLGEEMARLSRVAHRIVWANPRTQSPRYRPEVGGMAAAWPYCDAVVSAHSLTALADLITALADPSRPSRSFGGGVHGRQRAELNDSQSRR